MDCWKTRRLQITACEPSSPSPHWPRNGPDKAPSPLMRVKSQDNRKVITRPRSVAPRGQKDSSAFCSIQRDILTFQSLLSRCGEGKSGNLLKARIYKCCHSPLRTSEIIRVPLMPTLTPVTFLRLDPGAIPRCAKGLERSPTEENGEENATHPCSSRPGKRIASGTVECWIVSLGRKKTSTVMLALAFVGTVQDQTKRA